MAGPFFLGGGEYPLWIDDMIQASPGIDTSGCQIQVIRGQTKRRYSDIKGEGSHGYEVEEIDVLNASLNI